MQDTKSMCFALNNLEFGIFPIREGPNCLSKYNQGTIETFFDLVTSVDPWVFGCRECAV
jgi:hypothetical protein